ncbi:MAG: FKBP-type peptidyl-prolyl cis-trans isomerase [Phycisphaerales bacterium]|nr:FKBP-type peptidyl-prolyl cis-trans isomerase [Phycisphaerales bacterium]
MTKITPFWTPLRVAALLAVAGLAVATGCENSAETTSDADATSGSDAAQPAPDITPTPRDASGDIEMAVEPEYDESADQSTDEMGTDGGAAQAAPATEPVTEPADETPGEPGATTSSPFTELGIIDTVVGDGEVVQEGATVTLHYRGTLRETGEQFDASYDRGQPATFPLNNLIRGWQLGIPGMKVGGTRRLEIPWSLAYGEGGRPPVIPPRADLVFEIELIGVDNPEPPPVPELQTEFEGEPQAMGEGLVVRDIAVGSGQGEVKPGATVIAHYRGVLAQTGEQFDSSYDRGQPATFRLDPGALIEGFSRGLMGMKAGGSRRIEIPSALGYGERGSPPSIPPMADLIFEVEVLSFKNARELSTEWLSEETRENGVIVRTITEGDPEREPMPEVAIAVIHTLGVVEGGKKFDSTFDGGQPATVPLEQAVIEGWKQAVVGMRPGEARQFVVPPELGFGEEGQPPMIPSNSTLVFEVELIDWREPREFSTEFVGEAEEIEEGVTIRDVKIGEGPEAVAGQIALIHYLAQLTDGTIVANTFDAGDIQGVPLDNQPPLPGLRRAVIGMKQGGVRRIELSAEKAFGSEGMAPLVPPDSPMVFEVELMGAQ